MTATFLPRRARPAGDAGAGGGLADAALARGDYDDFSQWLSPVSCRHSRCGNPARFVKPGKPGRLEHSVQRRDLELSLFQPDLHGLAAQFRRDIVQHLVVPGHGDQFGVELAAEDARLFVALRAGQGAAAQGAVDVDGAVGDDFGAGADGG
jgi:hypothetical protein